MLGDTLQVDQLYDVCTPTARIGMMQRTCIEDADISELDLDFIVGSMENW